jgi:hypothetical protein
MSEKNKSWAVGPEPSNVELKDDGSRKREIWALPVEEAFLHAFLRDVFEQHWEGICFGPLIQGAAYEWRCSSAPTRIGLLDGYLTVMFGQGGHFHLCIGENKGSERAPTSPELRQQRKPSRAQIFRGFDSDGKPVTWGFEMWNGKAEPMISIFFPNPFINNDDSIAETPQWERLATWRTLSKKWLSRDAEALDEQGLGFGPKAAPH